jgi:hypothetical protein
MRKFQRFGLVALLAVATTLAPAFAGNVTVGRFYKDLAQAKHLGSVDGASAEASLRSAGFNLPSLSLDKSLTEGDMTSISSVLGLTVTTDRPSQLITEAQLNTFLASFGSQIGSQLGKAGTISETPNAVNGAKGKKKGHHKCTSEPI